MPCLYISTNVCLDKLDTDSFIDQATDAVTSLIGKPRHLVMVLVKGSVDIKLDGSREAAAYGEIVSMGGINTKVKRELIATIASILHTHFLVPRTRFFLKVYDPITPRLNSKL